MNQETGEGQQSSGSGLPDFSASSSSRSSPSLPDLATREGPVTLGDPSERALRRNRTTMLAVIGGAIVVMAVVALVLSQTVFRSVLAPTGPTAYQTGQRTAQGQSEYVPDPEDPDIAPPPPIFTQAPTTECTVPEGTEAPEPSAPGKVRGEIGRAHV